MKKIELGTDLYLIGTFKDNITKVEVIAIGKDMYVHSYSFNDNFVESFRLPLAFNEENTRWFRTLNAAKAYLKALYPDCKSIRKTDTDYWEVQFE